MRTADLTKPIYKHLVEQRWREEGALDLLVRHALPCFLQEP